MKNNVLTHAFFMSAMMLLALPLISGCNRNEASPEPVTTYKFDPLKETDAKVAAEAQTNAKAEAQTNAKAEAQNDTKAAAKTQKSARKPSSLVPKERQYIVQIGAFSKKENAEKLTQQLESKAYPVVIKTLEHKTLGSVYLVRLKPTTERSEADILMSQLKESEKLTPTLIIPDLSKAAD